MPAYSFPSEGAIWERIAEDTELGEYTERSRDVAPMGVGTVSVMTYLRGGGKWFLIPSYRLGALIGVNTRIVDDLLDGDGCEPVTEREEFLEKYIRSFSSGEAEVPVETAMEDAAYTAAEILHTEIERYDADVVPPMVEKLENMKELVVDDLYDDDIELDTEELEQIYQEAVDSFRRHGGIIPALLPKLDPVYAAINRASSAVKSLKHPELDGVST